MPADQIGNAGVGEGFRFVGLVPSFGLQVYELKDSNELKDSKMCQPPERICGAEH
jgi:hypothetical protein